MAIFDKSRIFASSAISEFCVVVPFIFHILVRYETFITRAQGPVIVIAKKFKLWSSKYLIEI